MDEYSLGHEIVKHMEMGDILTEKLKKLHDGQIDEISTIAAAEAMLVKIRFEWLKKRYGPIVPELVMMIVDRLEGEGYEREDNGQL